MSSFLRGVLVLSGLRLCVYVCEVCVYGGEWAGVGAGVLVRASVRACVVPMHMCVVSMRAFGLASYIGMCICACVGGCYLSVSQPHQPRASFARQRSSTSRAGGATGQSCGLSVIASLASATSYESNGDLSFWFASGARQFEPAMWTVRLDANAWPPQSCSTQQWQRRSI